MTRPILASLFLTFTAPDGYVVVPPVLSLDEFTSGSAVVVEWLGY